MPGISSPDCSINFEKSMVLPSTRTGVPVFILSDSKPSSTNCSVIPVLPFSPILPPKSTLSPINILPFKNVPLVKTTVLALIACPIWVLTPTTFLSSTIKETTLSCQKSKPSIASKANRHSSEKRIRSLCALGLHIAGPLDLFSILNWIIVLSVIIPL